jgi:hypothetical protein
MRKVLWKLYYGNRTIVKRTMKKRTMKRHGVNNHDVRTYRGVDRYDRVEKTLGGYLYMETASLFCTNIDVGS